jgi:hypothetical protein
VNTKTDQPTPSRRVMWAFATVAVVAAAFVALAVTAVAGVAALWWAFHPHGQAAAVALAVVPTVAAVTVPPAAAAMLWASGDGVECADRR